MRKKEHISWLGKIPTQRARSLKSRCRRAEPASDPAFLAAVEKDVYSARSLKSTPVASPPPVGMPPAPPLAVPPIRLLSLLTSDERKQYPMSSGLMDYFPDALAGVANISWRGNNKHNPGEALHWARGKSMDHADCILRHHAERGAFDTEGVRHSLQLAWRALALAQEELEAAYGLSTPRGASDAPK